MRKNWKAFALMMFLMLAAFISSNSAQSGDPDNPTPLSSNELKGSLGGADKEFYYSFVAGPGKVTVTVDIKASEGVTSMTLNFSAAESADVLVMSPATHRGSKREVDSFNLDERQTVVMKLASTGSYKGSYQIRLDGAVKSKSDSDAPSSDTDAPSSDTEAPSPPKKESSPKKESPPIIDLIRRAATEVESVRRFSADCLPKSGTLTFVMSDGTVKEINLKNVQKVSHKP